MPPPWSQAALGVSGSNIQRYISGGSDRGAKSIINGHVEDVEPASVHKGGKRYMKWLKPEDSGKEGMPLSHMAESHLDMLSAEEQEWLNGIRNSQQWI